MAEVAKCIVRFWASPNLVRIGSAMQHLFVTYLAYDLLKKHGKNLLEQYQEIFECIRIGIQERIDKLGTSNVEGYE